LQGKLLAELGLHVSEFRVESGLNCGGHAFGGKGQLLGPILEEFKREKGNLVQSLHKIRRQAWAALGRGENVGEPAPARVTVQGGIGEAVEDQLLREHYNVDGTGWGSPFLFVPEVVNLDSESLIRLTSAREADIDLSASSPLGVPFWSLRTSTSEETRRQRITNGKPGSSCPKGYLAGNAEAGDKPVCSASRAFQRRALEQINNSNLSAVEKRRAQESVVAKACICHDLAGCVTGPLAIDPGATTAVCCGPNAAYFDRVTTLDGMVDHIYGRASLPLDPERPHMLLKELALHLECLRRDIARHEEVPSEKLARSIAECRDNLLQGVQHYRELAGRLVAPRRAVFTSRLEKLQQELKELLPAWVTQG
jgi:hypothetical protein